MRYGAVTFIWTGPFRTGDLPLLRRVADLGFDVVEVPVDGDGLDAGALRAELDATGLEAHLLTFGTPDRDVSSEDEESRRRGVEHLTGCVELAAAAGATLLGGPIQEAVGEKRVLELAARAAERARAAEGLGEVAD